MVHMVIRVSGKAQIHRKMKEIEKIEKTKVTKNICRVKTMNPACECEHTHRLEVVAVSEAHEPDPGLAL